MEIYFREWREFAQMSQVELAQFIKVTPATVSRIEQGTRDFNGKYLKAFAKCVGCRHAADPLVRPPDILGVGTSESTPELAKKIFALAAKLNRTESKVK